MDPAGGRSPSGPLPEMQLLIGTAADSGAAAVPVEKQQCSLPILWLLDLWGPAFPRAPLTREDV